MMGVGHTAGALRPAERCVRAVEPYEGRLEEGMCWWKTCRASQTKPALTACATGLRRRRPERSPGGLGRRGGELAALQPGRNAGRQLVAVALHHGRVCSNIYFSYKSTAYCFCFSFLGQIWDNFVEVLHALPDAL